MTIILMPLSIVIASIVFIAFKLIKRAVKKDYSGISINDCMYLLIPNLILLILVYLMFYI